MVKLRNVAEFQQLNEVFIKRYMGRVFDYHRSKKKKQQQQAAV
jgi:hypothetical protein